MATHSSHPASRICLVRHGETEWNLGQRIQGHRDMPLNATGQGQAAALAAALAGQSFSAIYCSDLLRARQTAEPLAQHLGVQPMFEQELRERNFGCCEGQTYDEIMAGDADVALGFASRQPDFVLPGGESLLQHLERVERCLSRLAAKHAGECIAVITHGGVLDLVYRRARGVPIGRPREFPLPNASINWMTIDGTYWLVDEWANTDHLGEFEPLPFVVRV